MKGPKSTPLERGEKAKYADILLKTVAFIFNTFKNWERGKEPVNLHCVTKKGW